jgi:thymidylate synthase (FAD)
MKVELVDHMGTDLTVVNAARVSFDKASEWEHGFKMSDEDGGEVHYGEPCKLMYTKLSDKDATLIDYLARHNHWSPFAHTTIQLRIKAPIFVARQLVKHQVGGVWNEVSRRYVDSEPEFYFPEVWRGRPQGSIKQGSSGKHETSDDWDMVAKDHLDTALLIYNNMIADGVAPEQARMILPQNMMTEWYWTGSLMFFCRVCRERLAPGAQQETREVAEQIAEIVAPLFPVSWSALMGVDHA